MKEIKKLIMLFTTFLICTCLFSQDISNIFTQEIYDKYDVVFSNSSDFENVLYINPNYSGESDGTIDNPYSTLNDAPQIDNTAYLLKRGTSYEAFDHYEMNASNILIGAYGEGDRPKIIAEGRGGIIFAQSNVIIRDVELSYVQFGVWGNEISEVISFNVKMRSSWVWARNVRFIGCEVSGASRNGIFIQQRDFSEDNYVEIAYSHIHKVNQNWTPETGEAEASGDGIQISGFRGEYHIHNSIVDRSDTGNKFSIIINPHHNEINPVSGLIENNILRGPMPQPDGGSIIYIGNVQEATQDAHHELVVRNNEMYGSTYDGVNYTGAAIFSHSSKFEVYGNYVQEVPEPVFRLGNEAFGENLVYDNEVIPIGEEPIGDKTIKYEILEDESVQLTAVPEEGWEFEKWIIDNEEIIKNPIIIEMTENIEITVIFQEIKELEPIYYTLTINIIGEGQIIVN